MAFIRCLSLFSIALFWSALLQQATATLTPENSPFVAWLSVAQQHIRTTLPSSHMQAAKYYAGLALSIHRALEDKQRAQADRKLAVEVGDRCVVAYAANTYLNHFFPQFVTRHDLLMVQHLEGISQEEKKLAAQLGQGAANKIIKIRSGDGFDVFSDWHAPAVVNGVYRLLPNQSYPLFPQWGYTRPYSLTLTQVKRITSKFEQRGKAYMFSEEYYADLEETRIIGGSLSRARDEYDQQSPFFWADGDGTSTTPGHYVNIAALVLPDDLSLPQQAHFFATFLVAISDACIPCFRVKYQVNNWRPFHAITLGDDSERVSLDRNWKSYMTTPPHPSYPSGHSCVSGAAVAVFRAILGDACDVEVGSEGLPQAPKRRFTTFASMCQETGKSRVLGGLHYKKDCDDGVALAADVAKIVVKNIGKGLHIHI